MLTSQRALHAVAQRRSSSIRPGRSAGRALRLCLGALLLAGAAAGCSDDPPGDPLAPYLPELPEAGGPQVTRAGRLTSDNFERERVPGPASQGRVGDYFLRNDRVRVVVQQPGRAIAPLPYGGNIIDMDFVDKPVGDQFGEVGLFLLTGRTANFTEVEVVRDGSAGGPAVLRCRGGDVVDDYVTITALGPVAPLFRDSVRAERELGLKLAVTYILSPGQDHVDVAYTFYNPSGAEVGTSWGTMTDAGGDVWTYTKGHGFGQPSIQDLVASELPLNAYVAEQGDGVSYGRSRITRRRRITPHRILLLISVTI